MDMNSSRHALLGFLLLAAAAPGIAQADDARHGADRTTVLSVANRLVQAQAQYDQATLEQVLAPDYIEVSPLGQVDARNDVIGFYGKAPADKARAMDLSQTATLEASLVDIGRDRALVVGRQEVRVDARGTHRTVRFRAAFFLRRSGPDWLVVAAQYTPIREPDGP